MSNKDMDPSDPKGLKDAAVVKQSKSIKKNNEEKRVRQPKPQWSKPGDGFPAPFLQVFDLLSPAPIDGVRIRLMEVIQEHHKLSFGTDRLGPLTPEQLQKDRNSPHATITGNALINELIMAFAIMEESKYAFNMQVFENSKKEMMELLRLDRLEFECLGLKGVILSDGKTEDEKILEQMIEKMKSQKQNIERMTNEWNTLLVATKENIKLEHRENEVFYSKVEKVTAPHLNQLPAAKKLNDIINDPNKSDSERREAKSRLKEANRNFAEDIANQKTLEEVKDKLDDLIKDEPEAEKLIKSDDVAEKKHETVNTVMTIFAQLKANKTLTGDSGEVTGTEFLQKGKELKLEKTAINIVKDATPFREERKNLQETQVKRRQELLEKEAQFLKKFQQYELEATNKAAKQSD